MINTLIDEMKDYKKFTFQGSSACDTILKDHDNSVKKEMLV